MFHWKTIEIGDEMIRVSLSNNEKFMVGITERGDIFKRNIIGLQKDRILIGNVPFYKFTKISFSKSDTFIYVTNKNSVVVFKEDDNKEWIKSYGI